MLPALVLFRPLWTEPARARCISSLRYPNAFWPECYRVPCFFYAYPGRISNNPHESMETRCVLPSMRNIAAPADCTRSRFGAGRNRYIRIIVRLKLLYAGSAEDQRNAAPPHNPVRRSFAEKQPGPFPYPALRLNTCNFNSIPATDLAEQLDQGLMGPPPHNPVRRSLRYVTGLRGCSHAAQKSKSRLSVAANKSCLQGWPFKIWSCAPAPYGKGSHVCAASTGRVLQPVPGAVSALNSSLSEVASLCSTGTAPFFKAIPPHANPQNGARIDEQGKTP